MVSIPQPALASTSALTRLPIRRRNRLVYNPEQVLRGHVARCGDLAVRADPRVHAVAVEHLDPTGNVRHSLRTEAVVVVVNEQVRPEARQLPLCSLRRCDPHVEVGALAVERERDGLAVHLGRYGYQDTDHTLRFIL